MKVFTKISMAATLITFGVLGFTGITMAATAPSLGLADGYSVFGKAGITDVPTSHVWGNVGADLLSAIDLIDSEVDGSRIQDDGSFVQFDIATAYGALTQTPATGISLAGTVTVTPGVRTVLATETLDGTVTLSGAGVYIFRSANAFHVGNGASMIFAGGATECNVTVFWQIPTSMTIGTTAHIIGTIITESSHITFGSGATLQGRAFALGAGQVTLINNQITQPTCTVTGGSNRIPRLIPLINILKVPTPLVLVGSGLVTYNYTVQNIGPNLALRNITVNDDKCGPVTYISGDVNNDGRLELTEKWYYRCTTTLSATTTNIVTVRGESDDSYRDVATDTATAIVVVTTGATITGLLTSPLINIVKIPDRLTPFTVGGGDVTYTYTVTNPGIVAMHDVVVTDDKCSPVSLIRGDINHDHLLDVNETWIYICASHISASTKNTATAKGVANGFTVYDYAFANVYVTPGLPKTGLTGTTPWNIIILASILMIVSTSLIVASKKRTI